MTLEKQKQSAFTPRPQSFADLMEMYEMNYIYLRLLCGDIKTLPDQSDSTVSVGGLAVRINILERTPHTTIFMMTYLFDKEERRPDLKIQVYHDSRQADVISRDCRFTHKNRRAWERDIDNVLLCRWRLNRFLFKWMKYLYRQGHSFEEKNSKKT